MHPRCYDSMRFGLEQAIGVPWLGDKCGLGVGTKRVSDHGQLHFRVLTKSYICYCSIGSTCRYMLAAVRNVRVAILNTQLILNRHLRNIDASLGF